MNKLLYLSVAAITLSQLSSPTFAMDPERCGHHLAPKQQAEDKKPVSAKQSRFAVTKKVDRFDPPAMVDNDALLKIYGAALVGTNMEPEAHELNKKLTRRPVTIGESGTYVEIDLNGITVKAAHKEPSTFAQERKLKAIQSNVNVVAILIEPETRVIPTMGVNFESVGGKYSLQLVTDSEKMEPVLTEIEGFDYSGPKPVATTKQVETFVNLVFTREQAKKQ